MTEREPASAAARTRQPAMVDVAHEAGVSAQTVSRTLRGHANVHPDIRERVLAAVDRLGYRMNSAARALSSGRTRTIGLISLTSVSYSQSSTQMSVEQTAEEHGYLLVGARTSSLDARSIATAMRHLERQGAEGIILSVPLFDATDEIASITTRIPTVILDGSQTEAARVLPVDQQRVASIATEHLLELGHDTVWHVSGPQNWTDASSRTRGWEQTLTQHGRDVMPPLRGDWTPESGYQAGRVIARIDDATAVFVSSDEMAFGVLRALAEAGRRVPDDVSVVGVDDIPLAAYSSPALTTVSQPFADHGRAAVADLIDRLDGTGDDDTFRQRMADLDEPRLIVRATTTAKAAPHS